MLGAQPAGEQGKLIGRMSGFLSHINLFRLRHGQPEGRPKPLSGSESAEVCAVLAELAGQNIVFWDNQGYPLYSLDELCAAQDPRSSAKAKQLVLANRILDETLAAFQELSPDVRAIPMPTRGRYVNTPIDWLIEALTDQDILAFFAYVRRRPAGYAGRNFRITEAFTGWAVSGTPEA